MPTIQRERIIEDRFLQAMRRDAHSFSGENRIYIEVKDTEPLGHNHYGIEDSQVVRYFLHLIAMSKRNKGVTDIRRAVLLCAPAAWFNVKHNARAWAYFRDHLSGLASAFDITIGELHADSF